jgi:citrate lyase subunit beta/citryl-CoA lyase
MAADIRPRRSVLYMPGSNARALEKARTLPADALILDLEDAVAPDAKDLARRQVADAVKARGFGKREIVIRINALSTPWGEADLEAAAEAKPDAILVPKVSAPRDLHEIEARLMRVGCDTTISVWAMVETPLATLNIGQIAAAGGRLQCFIMGTNDLVKEIQGRHTPDRMNLAASLSLSVLAARAHAIAVIDGVYNDIQDTDGFSTICRQARDFGFDGKTLIHPSQVEPCNAIFAPSPEEVIAARALIAAFELPENKGKGAIKHEGRMVELLHAEIARRTVAISEAIAELEAA